MKKFNFDIASFLAGVCVSTWLAIGIFFGAGGSININGSTLDDSKTASANTDDSTSTEDTTSEQKWNTSEKKHVIDVDGKKLTFYTPTDFFSLTDQYLSNMGSYYGKTLKSESFYCVGNNETASAAAHVITANKLSDMSVMLKQLYGDNYDETNVQKAPAYVYMTTGKIPDNAPDNYKIKEVTSLKVSDVTFKVYETEYDQTYEVEGETSEESKSGEKKKDKKNKKDDKNTEVVHYKEMCAYSDTKDTVEVVFYMNEYDKDSALKELKEFLGAK